MKTIWPEYEGPLDWEARKPMGFRLLIERVSAESVIPIRMKHMKKASTILFILIFVFGPTFTIFPTACFSPEAG
jgi:hypothetical protein